MLNFSKKVVGKYCALITILMLLTGCNVTADEKSIPITSDSPDYLKSLAWVNSANAEKDASTAIAAKDFRLLVIASRGEAAPGIDSSMVKELKQRCGIRYIQGSTDAIRGEAHMAALKKAYDYARSYNQIIAEHCSK